MVASSIHRNRSRLTRPTIRRGKRRGQRRRKSYPLADRSTFNVGTVGICRNPTAITDSMLVKLKYSQAVDLTSGANPGSHVFNMNSIFDPNFTGVGHQPLGYDEWSNFYAQYCVYGASWNVRIVGDGNAACLAGVLVKPNSTLLNNFDTIRERPYSQDAICGLQGSNKHIQCFKGFMSTKRIFGLKTLTVADDQYIASFGANPSNSWYLHLYAQHIDRSTAASSKAEVELTYYVKLFNRKNLLQS